MVPWHYHLVVFATTGRLARGLGSGALACALVLCGACDDAEGADDMVTPRSAQSNGAQLNGFQLNGFQLNGFQLNGFQLNGLQLNGAENGDESISITEVKLKGGAEVVDSWLDEGNLHVRTAEGVLSGKALKGTKIRFDVTETNKKGKKIKIKRVRELAPGSGILVYDIRLKVGQGSWVPLCHDSKGMPTEAILVGSVWSGETAGRVHETSPDLVTFACRDAAIAKCVEFGYRPWAEAGGEPLSELHQACTRMVRADYCGDAISHTVNGTGIHVLDKVGIQAKDAGIDYVVEAEWGPGGATCLNAVNTRIDGEVPDCSIPACGSDFASGGLLQSGKITNL